MFTSVLPTAPCASFPKSPRSQPVRSTSPGPAYDITQGLNATQKRAPGVSGHPNWRCGSADPPLPPLCPTHALPPPRTPPSLPLPCQMCFGSSPRTTLAFTAQCEASPSDYPQPPALGPHTVRSTMPGSPAYTLKARARSTPAAPSPSPQSYNVPALVGGGLKGPATARSMPAFSLRPRTVDALPQSLHNPAPGHYGAPGLDSTRAVSPAFSLRSRAPGGGMVPGGSPLGPGEYPGASAQASSLRARAPAYTLRPRTVDPAEEAAHRRSPGPAAHAPPPALGATALWPNPGGTGFALKSRQPALAPRGATPGPGDYDTRPATPGRSPLSTQRNSSNPSSSATWSGATGAQLAAPPRAGSPPSLGPNSYHLPSAFAAGDRSPFKRSGGGFSITSRTFHGSPLEGPLLADTPAPDAYGAPSRPVALHPQPRFAHSPRLPPGPAESLCGPGAPVSHAAVAHAAPRYSLRSRSASPHRSADALGPAAFNLQGGVPAVDPAPPSWSMRIRWRPPRGPAEDVPGPGAYGMVQLPHLALLMARTAHFGFPSSDSVRRTNPQLYSDYTGVGSGREHEGRGQGGGEEEEVGRRSSSSVSWRGQGESGGRGASSHFLPIARAPAVVA